MALLPTAVRADVSGVVLDQATNRPLSGAVVVVEWRAQESTFYHASDVCLHVESAVTDKDGHYRVGAGLLAWSPIRSIMLSGHYQYFSAYKFNHELVMDPKDPQGVLRLRAMDQSAERWFYPSRDDGRRVPEEHWFWYRIGYPIEHCADQDSEHNLYRLFDAFARDAEAIAITPEQVERAALVRKYARRFLVNWSRPTKPDPHGDGWVNADPADAYTPETLLK